MNGLNEVVELIVDPNENHSVAMPLEIAALSGQLLLCRKEPDFAVREVNHTAFSLVIVHRSVNLYGLWHNSVNFAPLRFKIEPEDKACVWVTVDDFFC